MQPQHFHLFPVLRYIYKFINISLCVPCAHSQICSGITFSRLLCARERADKLLAHKPCAMKLIRRQLFAPLDAKSDIVSLLYVIEDTSNGVQVHIQREIDVRRGKISRVCVARSNALYLLGCCKKVASSALIQPARVSQWCIDAISACLERNSLCAARTPRHKRQRARTVCTFCSPLACGRV